MSYGHYPPQHGGPANYYPPPQHPHDPFRAWYAQQLAQLTFNSRPMIQNLSIEAQNRQQEGNWPAMEAIVQEIEDAILRAPPQGKLPLLYLIDSISKNVGPPFTDTLLPPILPQLYLATYRQVDGVTKSKMADLVRLWRTGGPNGTELYPPAMREAVERDMFGGSGPLTQASVQAMLKEFLNEKKEEMGREWTQQRGKTVNTLVNLDKILSNSRVSPRELADISDRIQAMKGGQQVPAPSFPPTSSAYAPRVPPQAPPAVRQPPPPQPPQQQFGGAQQRWGGNSPYGAGAGYPPPQQNYPPPPQQQNLAPPQPPAAPVAIPALPVNVSDLLSKLTSSGILSQPRTPEPSAAKPQKSGLETYEDMVLAFNIQVDHFDLSRVGIPMAHLPVRCNQCGLRFPEGDNKLQPHLDWHFRRNRKERETAGRGGHRRWLPRADEWVNETAEAGPSSPTKTEAAVLPETLSSDKIAALKRKWVPVPDDPVKAAKPCPIDKEKFESVYSEEEEEWVFMNAVDVNGTIYHATCLAEKKASNVAKRVLNRDAGRASSKSPAPGTPEPEASPAPSPRKRKAEGEEADEDAKRVKVETDGGAVDAVAESAGEGVEASKGDASDGGVNGGGEGGGDVSVKVEVEEAAAPAPAPQDATEALEAATEAPAE